MAIKDSLSGISWIEWPAELKNRDQAALDEAGKKLSREVAFYRFQQFWFFKQWTELKAYVNDKGVEIIGDVPIYVLLTAQMPGRSRSFFSLMKRICR